MLSLKGDDPKAELDRPPLLHMLRGGHGAARRLHLRMQDHGGRLPVQPGTNHLSIAYSHYALRG